MRIANHTGALTASHPDCVGVNYVFSHFCGIYLASTVYFLIYCAIMRNRPHVYPRAILPGIACGALWATAQACYFVANSDLGLVTSFPIISSLPGFVASMWGILVFKEITGKRNLLIVGAAFTLSTVAVVCIALAKVG